MIDELEIKKYDKMFGTRSKIFSETNTIIISTPLDEWKLKISNKKVKGICVYHKNIRSKQNKYHVQGYKSCLYHAYHSIYTHKNWLRIVNAHPNTYPGKNVNLTFF